jgi:hypothetical protein
MLRLFAMRPYTKPLRDVDENEQRRITILNGQLCLVDNGIFIQLTSPIVFKTGIIITMDGIMNMPDGKTRMLREGDFVSPFIL